MLKYHEFIYIFSKKELLVIYIFSKKENVEKIGHLAEEKNINDKYLHIIPKLFFIH